MSKVDVDALLGREPVQVDPQVLRSELEGKRIMVTGAAGSIGSELCRQLVKYNPASLSLLDVAETPLYQINKELTALGATKVFPCIGDIRNVRNLRRIYEVCTPQIVYHAAAYKHIPMMEAFPIDGVENNVLGTLNLATVSHIYEVEKFILVSTDKAVRPTSVMGATKRVAELAVHAMGNDATKYIVVRFGNVLGSSGSVVPLFQQQIDAGGPLTITHPEVTRYFMTIKEACLLLMQASAIGQGGELFLLDMGEPIKIVDLAKNMIRLAGHSEQDIEIRYTGLRPGEKLYEELLMAEEGIMDTAHHKIKVCRAFNGVRTAVLSDSFDQLRQAVHARDTIMVLAILQTLVPDFKRIGAA